MTTSTEALIDEFASVPTPPSPPPSPLSPWSSPCLHIPSSPLPVPSPLLPLPSPPTLTSPTYADAPLGYEAAMIRSRAASPPLLYEVEQSLAAAAARQTGHALTSSVDYGYITTMDVNIRISESKAMIAIREVNERVTDLTITKRQETYKIYVYHWDDQEDHDVLRAQVSLLTREMRYFHLMASSYEREKMPLKRTTTPMSDVAIKALEAKVWPTHWQNMKQTEVEMEMTPMIRELAREGQSTLLCAPKCNNYKKVGHLVCDCRSPTATTNTQRAPMENQRVFTCFECRLQEYYKKDCPKLKNNNCGNYAGNGGEKAKA
nr:hypothetical protein [Tanacetum cinerariifolium]